MGGQVINQQQRDESFRRLRTMAREACMEYKARRRAINKERNRRIRSGWDPEEAYRIAGRSITLAKARYCMLAEVVRHWRAKMNAAKA